MPLGVFCLRNVSGGNACSLLLSSTILATFFFLALYMQRVLGYTAIENGLAFLPISVAVIMAARLASQLVNRFGFKPLLVAGFAFRQGAGVVRSRMVRFLMRLTFQ